MESHRTLFLCVTMVLFPLLLFNSPTANAAKEAKEATEAKPAKKAAKAAAKPAVPKADNSYKAVNEFCNQRSTSEDRSFCAKVLKANPKSAKAKETPQLLKIAIELALGNIKKTRDFLGGLALNKGTKPPLKPVLQECIVAYDFSLKQIERTLGDLEDDPPMASYDARQATESFNRCQNSINTSKVSDPSIASRNKIASQYARLLEELSNDV